MFYYCGINYLATIEMRYEENVALIFEHTLQFLSIFIPRINSSLPLQIYKINYSLV